MMMDIAIKRRQAKVVVVVIGEENVETKGRLQAFYLSCNV